MDHNDLRPETILVDEHGDFFLSDISFMVGHTQY